MKKKPHHVFFIETKIRTEKRSEISVHSAYLLLLFTEEKREPIHLG